MRTPMVVPMDGEVADVFTTPLARPMAVAEIAALVGQRTALKTGASTAPAVSHQMTEALLGEMVTTGLLLRQPGRWWSSQGLGELAANLHGEVNYYGTETDLAAWRAQAGNAAARALQNRAKQRALYALRDRHPEEYERLVEEISQTLADQRDQPGSGDQIAPAP